MPNILIETVTHLSIDNNLEVDNVINCICYTNLLHEEIYAENLLKLFEELQISDFTDSTVLKIINLKQLTVGEDAGFVNAVEAIMSDAKHFETNIVIGDFEPMMVAFLAQKDIQLLLPYNDSQSEEINWSYFEFNN